MFSLSPLKKTVQKIRSKYTFPSTKIWVRDRILSTLKELGLASTEETEILKKRLQMLEKKLSQQHKTSL